VIWTLGLLPVGLMLLGFPIFLVLLAAVTSTLVLFMQVPLTVLHQTMFGSLDAVALLAIPFFIYAGELMGSSSVAGRMVDAVGASVVRMPGSLGVTTVGTATIFGACVARAPQRSQRLAGPCCLRSRALATAPNSPPG